MFESLKSDFKSAFSTLRHRPGVAAAVVLTLSLGIAANTAVFSLVDAVLLKPLPYPEPERIVTLWNRYGTTRTASSPPDYMDRRRESRLLELSAAWTAWPANLSVEGKARRVETTQVTSDFFRVMGHVEYESLDEPGRFQLYFPAFQRYWWRHLDFTLEGESDAAVLIPYARAEVARLAPDLAVHSIRTLDTLVADSLAFRELQTALVGAFGLVVVALAAVGIYGVLSYSVSQRLMEVGLRMALGASRKTILGLVLKEGLMLAGLGVALGWMGALAAARLFSDLLYGIEPTDTTSYVAVTAALSVVALAAALVPALRASRTDPWSSLRGE